MAMVWSFSLERACSSLLFLRRSCSFACSSVRACTHTSMHVDVLKIGAFRPAPEAMCFPGATAPIRCLQRPQLDRDSFAKYKVIAYQIIETYFLASPFGTPLHGRCTRTVEQSATIVNTGKSTCALTKHSQCPLFLKLFVLKLWHQTNILVYVAYV